MRKIDEMKVWWLKVLNLFVIVIIPCAAFLYARGRYEACFFFAFIGLLLNQYQTQLLNDVNFNRVMARISWSERK